MGLIDKVMGASPVPKVTKCPDCKNKATSRSSCRTCDGTGHVADWG